MADKKYASITAITQLWAKIKALIPTKVSDLTNDSGFQTASDVSTAVSGKVSKSGDTMTGNLTFGSSSAGTVYKYNDNSYFTIRVNGYNGDATNNTPRMLLRSYKANTSGGSEYCVRVGGMADPYEDIDGANKRYVDNLWTSTKITNTLGYTPYNGTTNPNGYITLSDLPLYDGSYTQTAEGGSY